MIWIFLYFVCAIATAVFFVYYSTQIEKEDITIEELPMMAFFFLVWPVGVIMMIGYMFEEKKQTILFKRRELTKQEEKE